MLFADIKLSPDLLEIDYREFSAIEPPPLLDTGPPDVGAASEDGYPVFDGLAADCRAVLVSERGLFLDGVRSMLGKSRISVIGEGRNVLGLLSAMRTRPVPELVVCHIAFDREPGAVRDLIGGLRQHFPRAKLVILADTCTTLLKSGIVAGDVSAVLLTSISGDMLLQSLELILCDYRLLPSEFMSLTEYGLPAKASSGPAQSVSAAILEKDEFQPDARQIHLALPGASPNGPQSMVPLAKRERQVMDCLVRGLSNKCIARELDIVEGTVKVYLKCLSRKLKVANRTQLAIWALRQPRQLDGDGPVASEGR